MIRHLKSPRDFLSLIAAVVLIAGCAGTEDYAQNWVGEPIADLIEAKHKPDSYASKSGWKEQRYDLKEGHWVYVSPSREGCIIHWEVDKRGVIVGFRTEGAQC
jgi:hypothetical protein